MDNVTFEKLPEIVAALNEKVDTILRRMEMQDTQSPPPPSGKELLTAAEVAELLGKSVATIYSMTSEKRIPFRKRGNKLYFFRDEVMQWIKDGGQSGNATPEDYSEHLAMLRDGKKHKPKG